MTNAVIIDRRDNIIVVIEPVAKGSTVSYTSGGEEVSLAALDDITIYHKIARTDIVRGASVIKYGERIGEATVDIPKGAHVHVHNISNIKDTP